ncbi:uncharacterized protein [Dysidea avara]|uniref:uncharacterized protein isoform X1 n=1 Tax=Dysidea avara TaxID=196820 RepID=UPI00332D6B12
MLNLMKSVGFLPSINRLIISLVLLFTNVNSSFVVTRFDHGDEFSWSGIADCHRFSRNSAYGTLQKCHCDYGLTFSTETTITNQKCQDGSRAHYLLSRQGLDGLSVSTVYLTCIQDGTCGLRLVKDNTERPLATQSKVLTTDKNCKINYVEIIHDCKPRNVLLELHLVPRDSRFYLEVQQSVENLETLVEGELFQVDIICDGVNGMLLLKFNGSRVLSNRGSFDDIPAYNPLDKRCSYIPEIPVNPAVILDGEHHKSDSILIVIVLTISSVVVVVVVLFIGATIPIYKWAKRRRRRYAGGGDAGGDYNHDSL